jgi:hypothetical protein
MGLREQANEASAILRGVDAAAARAASPTVTADEIEAEVHGKVIASEWIRLGAAMLRLRAEIWRGITRS